MRSKTKHLVSTGYNCQTPYVGCTQFVMRSRSGRPERWNGFGQLNGADYSALQDGYGVNIPLPGCGSIIAIKSWRCCMSRRNIYPLAVTST